MRLYGLIMEVAIYIRMKMRGKHSIKKMRTIYFRKAFFTVLYTAVNLAVIYCTNTSALATLLVLLRSKVHTEKQMDTYLSINSNFTHTCLNLRENIQAFTFDFVEFGLYSCNENFSVGFFIETENV
jgi:hypothetical protein